MKKLSTLIFAALLPSVAFAAAVPPVVIIGGQLQQIPSADTITAASVPVDGTTIVVNGAVVSTAGAVVAGTTQTVTTAQWAAGDIFYVTTASQTLTLPAASTLSSNGTIAIQTIGQSATLAPNAADAINGGTTGASITIGAGVTAYVTKASAANTINVAPTTRTVAIGTDVSGLGTGVGTALGVALSGAGGVTSTIASGTAAMGTGAISSATCATVVTVSATNVATTDVVLASFNGDPTAVTGYIPATSGMLTIISYPTANNVNFKVCNNTSGSITPGAITLNWRVVR